MPAIAATHSPIRSPLRSPTAFRFGGVSVGDQAIEFGALTLASAGAAIPAYSGTPTSPTWSIQSGNTGSIYQIDSSTGALSTVGAGTAANRTLGCRLVCTEGTFNFTVTVTAIANSYSVKDMTEAKAALADIGTAGSGARSVYCRYGAYATDNALLLNRAFTNQVTIRAHDSANPPVYEKILVDNSDNVRLYQIRINDTSITGGSGIINAANTPVNFTVEECTISGIAYDPTADYSVVPYPGNGDGITGSYDGLIFKNNTVFDVEVGIAASSLLGNVEITGNLFYNQYEDMVKISRVNPTGTTTKINDNVGYGSFGLGTDDGNPHSDAIQLLGGSLTHDWVGIEILRNRFFNNGRGEQQLIFLDDAPVGIYYSGAVIKGNAGFNGGSNGIYINRAKDCVVIGNTVVKWDPAESGNATNLSIGNTQSSGTHKVWNNICENGPTSLGTLCLKQNVTLGNGGATIPYGTVFAGPSFSPPDLSAVMSSFDSGGYSTGQIGAIGTGYVTFSSAVPGQVGVAIDTTFEKPTISAIEGVGGGGTAADLETTTDDHTGALYWYVSTSATPPSSANLKSGSGAVSSGSFSVTATGTQSGVAISGLSAATNYYAHAIHTNGASIDSAIATSAVFTTAGAGYTPTYVDNNGTAYITRTGGPSNDAQGTWAFLIKPQQVASTVRLYQAAGRTDIQQVAAKLRVIIKDSANATVYDATTTNNVFSVGTQVHVYIGVDLSVPSIVIAVDGVDLVATAAMTVSTSLIAGTGLVAHSRNQGVLAIDTGTSIADVQIADYYFDPTQVVALSSFYSGGPLDLTGVGSPYIRFGDGQSAADWNTPTNLGSATSMVIGSATFS